MGNPSLDSLLNMKTFTLRISHLKTECTMAANIEHLVYNLLTFKKCRALKLENYIFS